MKSLEEINRSYVGRRKKEYLPLMIVRFLRAYDSFQEVYADFLRCERGVRVFGEARLFERTKYLAETLFLDVKDKSHFLFREKVSGEEDQTAVEAKLDDLARLLESQNRAGGRELGQQRPGKVFAELKKSLLNKSIDSIISRTFHLLLILSESFYELEFYKTRYAQEHRYVERIAQLLERSGYPLSEKERHELDHIRRIDGLTHNVMAETVTFARRALERARSLFQDTSEILLHIIQESGRNEVLVLNLLREADLVDKIYGKGALDRLFSEIFADSGIEGESGVEQAVNYLKVTAGNISGLPERLQALLGPGGDGESGDDASSSRQGAVRMAQKECYFPENT